MQRFVVRHLQSLTGFKNQRVEWTAGSTDLDHPQLVDVGLSTAVANNDVVDIDVHEDVQNKK